MRKGTAFRMSVLREEGQEGLQHLQTRRPMASGPQELHPQAPLTRM